MTIIKAIEHFQFKFKKHWKATKTDSDALKILIDFVNEKHKQQLQDYHLFAKVYIFMYAYFLEHYKTDLFDMIPQKELNRYLDQPIEKIIERFKNKLNESELYTKFSDLDIVLEHPITKTHEVKEKEIEALRSAKNTFDDVWDYKTVKEQLESMINLSIDEYK